MCLVSGPTVGAIPLAYADEAAEQQDASEPRVVREDLSRRTETSKHYLLSDGTYRARIFETPIHFKDDDDQWRDIETDLVPGDSVGEWRTNAAPATARFRPQEPGKRPVRLERDGWAVELDMLGVAEDSKLVMGNKARYLGVARDTDLEYEALDNGLKETLVLSSSNAPTSYTFFMALDGLQICQTTFGDWILVDENGDSALNIGDLIVFDSSQDKAGNPVECEDATMSVTAASGGAYVTYTLSQAWLDDPSRVFPVMVDPTLVADSDTFISSGTPTTGRGTSTELLAGYYDSSLAYNRGLVRFPLASISKYATVTSATYKSWQFWQYYENTSTDTYLARMDKTWSEASTWSSLAAAVNNWNGFATGIGPRTTTTRWQEVDWLITATVQDWVHGTRPNYGLVHYQSEYGNQNTTHFRKFYSSEYAGIQYRPQLEVDYYTPYASMTPGATFYKQGDTASATMKVNTSHTDDVSDMRMLVNYVGGSSSTYRGYLGWFDYSPLPAGWIARRTLVDGSVLAEYIGSTFGTDHITFDWNACTYGNVTSAYGYKRVTFEFKLNDSGVIFGEQQDNDFDTHFYMGTGEWASGWVNQNTNVDVAVYSNATKTSSVNPASARLGTDAVTEVLTINTSYPSDVRQVELLPNQTRGSSYYRGYFAWFRDSVPTGWTSLGAASGGGYWAKNSAATTYGLDKVSFQPSTSSVSSTASSKTFTLKWLPETDYGDVQDNRGDYRISMGAYANSVWDTGWVTPAQTYDVLPAPVTDASAQTSASDWFTEVDRDSDGKPENMNDANGHGRGDVALSWTASPLADGYRIYLYDGAEYRKVGETVGNSATNWSSAGMGFFPSDSEIAGKLPDSWMANPFYRGSSPSAATREATGTVDVPGESAGLVVTDGSYLYVREYSENKVVSQWAKVGTGLAGTSKGQVYGTIGPDLSERPASTAFYFDGFIYNGFAVAPDCVEGVSKSARAGDAEVSRLVLPAPMLRYSDGLPVTAVGSGVMLATDGERIFSVSAQDDKDATHKKVRVFERDGTYADHLVLSSGSFDGVFADGENLYFLDGGTSGSVVTRVSTVTWTVTGQWDAGVNSTHEVGGAYDPANNVFWIGSADSGHVYRHAGPGLDLRDSANALYAATDGTSYDARSDYAWRVVPFSEQGELSVSDNNLVNTTLADRTVGVNDEPRHTTYDLGEMAGQGAIAVLDQGDLELRSVDLSIDSFGPGAALARTYDSEDTTGTFAPGWHFGFEETLDVVGSLATYTDGSGEEHRFILEGGVWYSPLGFRGTLAADGGAFEITSKDRSVRRFEGGLLVSETDHNGNTTTYDRSLQDHILITAANGHVIDVETSETVPVRATYSAPEASATREVLYSRLDTSTADVTYFPDAPEGYRIRYSYGPDSRIASVTLLDDDGTTELFAGTQASWGFAYTSGDLATVSFPEHAMDADSTLSLAYSGPAPSGETTVTLSRTGVSVGTNDDATVTEWRVVNPTGTLARSYDATDTATPDACWTYSHTPDGEPFEEISPTGKKLSRTYDIRGNAVYDFDELGHRNAYRYDAFDQIVRSTDPLGCTTYSTYDATGNLVAQERQLNQTDRERTEYEYHDAAGRTTLERRRIVGDEWAVTRYAYHADWPTAQVTHKDGVQLHRNAAPQTITTTVSFDAWGNTVAQTDGLGVTTTRDEYGDTGLRVLESEDASGVVTHTRYDLLGNTVETRLSAPGTSVKADWKTSVIDVFGRTRSETNWLHDGSSATAQSTQVRTYDALGREVASNDSLVDGASSETQFDARGNVIRQWPEGLASHTDANATISHYDEYGQLTKSYSPGATNSTSYVYNADGTTARTDSPDGTWTTYTYDDAGNQIAVTTQDGTTTTRYDVGGRTVSSTSADGVTTTHVFDLLSREVTVTGAGNENASTNVYNHLGQVLVATDADGIVTETVYDAAGRTTATSVAGKTTATVYDATGKTLLTTDPDGKELRYTHDSFGRVTEEIHTTGAGVVRHTVATADSLGRTISTADVKTGVQRAFSYPSAPGEGTTVAVTYAGITTTITADHAGRELSRASQLPSGTLVRTVLPRDSAERETSWTVGPISFVRTLRSEDGKLTGLSVDADTLSYGYDVSARKASDGGSLPLAGLMAATYEYTATGRLATDTVSGATASYQFDAAGNLATETAGALTTVYSYGAGNRVEQTSRGGLVTTYGWDTAHGWRTSARASGEASVTYTYTGTGRLASYTDPNRAVTATYEYDAAGQRTRSVVTSGSVTTEMRYVYEGLSLLSLAATETAGSSVSTYSVSYLFDASGSPYAGLYASGEATAVPFTTVTTDRGDIVELRDSSGAAFAAYRYDAWGVPLSVATSATASIDATCAAAIAVRQPLRYAGYCWDEHSGCYYLSARTYEPATRQFLTKDPARADGEESAYQYCGGDPVGKVDPSGLFSIRIGDFAMWTTWYKVGRGNVLIASMRIPGYRSREICLSNPYYEQFRSTIYSTYWKWQTEAYAGTVAGVAFMMAPGRVALFFLGYHMYGTARNARSFSSLTQKMRSYFHSGVAWENRRRHYTQSNHHKL